MLRLCRGNNTGCPTFWLIHMTDLKLHRKGYSKTVGSKTTFPLFYLSSKRVKLLIRKREILLNEAKESYNTKGRQVYSCQIEKFFKFECWIHKFKSLVKLQGDLFLLVNFHSWLQRDYKLQDEHSYSVITPHRYTCRYPFFMFGRNFIMDGTVVVKK